MAARKVEKVSLRKKAGVKNSLGNPYFLTWPAIERQVHDTIINEIRSKFPAVLSRRSVCKTRRKQLESTDKEALTEEDKILIEQIKEKQELRKCLAVGINEVTRGFERDELKLVLVCRSVKPSIVTDHLLLLGATRQVPTVGLYDLGPVLGPLLQCNKTAALGFKKQDKETVFDSLVEDISPMVPDINVPWLKPFVETKQETSINRGCTLDVQENEGSEQTGKKRRHSADSRALDDSNVNKKQKVEEDVKQNETKPEKPKENVKQLDQEIQDKRKEDSKSKLQGVRISFEPVVIKQTPPNPNKTKTEKRKRKNPRQSNIKEK